MRETNRLWIDPAGLRRKLRDHDAPGSIDEQGSAREPPWRRGASDRRGPGTTPRNSSCFYYHALPVQASRSPLSQSSSIQLFGTMSLVPRRPSLTKRSPTRAKSRAVVLKTAGAPGRNDIGSMFGAHGLPEQLAHQSCKGLPGGSFDGPSERVSVR